MDPTLVLLGATVTLCYIYAFVGGFTDAANAIATAVGTRALSPKAAVLMAGVLEIAGALTGTAVALTIGKGLVDLELISMATVLAALLGAMTWSLITYYLGLPVSETHGLVGAIIGAAVGVAGMDVIVWGGLNKVLIAIVASPILGLGGGALVMMIIHRVCQNAPAAPAHRAFKQLQRLSAAFMAFSHGRNDAQKPMGILVMALALHYGTENLSVPLWVILSVGVVAGLGVAAGGWRIIKTLGMKITHLTPEQGFAAESAAAGVLQLASFVGIPVSTTHTITSSIVGAGMARRVRSIRWGLVTDIVMSWVFTLPATIILGWASVKILSAIF